MTDFYDGTYLARYFRTGKFDLIVLTGDMLDVCQHGTIEDCNRYENILEVLQSDGHMGNELYRFYSRSLSNYKSRLLDAKWKAAGIFK